MRLRLVLVFLSLFLSLATSADRTTDSCRETWTPNSNTNAWDGFGVNIHFTDPQPGEIKMIAEAGIRWIRMDFKWDATEKQPGQYDFSSYDRLLASLEAYRLHALLILDYGNPLYDHGEPPRTEATRQAFARWATAAAKHFAGHGVIWEVYNEPNLNIFWPPRSNVDEYVALALAVGRSFRGSVPDEKLIGPATSGIDFPFLEACFKAGLLDYWSAVSVHPYRRSEPETAANDYCRLRKLIAKYAGYRTARASERYRTRSGSDGVIPIISSEWGFSSVWTGMTDGKQSEMLAREILTNVANGIPISIWYDWRDDGTDPNEAEHHFGLVRNAYQSGHEQIYQPKAAYLGAKIFSEYLNGYTFQKRLSVGTDNDYVLVFARGGEIRIAAWTTSTNPHRVVIPVRPGRYEVIDHTGKSLGTIVAGPRDPEIRVSASPVYLVTDVFSSR